MKTVKFTAARRVRELLRRDRLPPAVPVIGGPFDGHRVRVVATTRDGAWIRDRYYLCRPAHQRGTPRDLYPYQLRDGAYVWNDDTRSNQ